MRVFVGLSGGVDSATSAYLLKRQGYDVTGVFIKVWQPPWWPCSAARDRLDAMRVCAHLDIPFRTLDLTEEYRRGVVEYMVREYAAGRTPNPDVMCNREIKFGAFLAYACRQGVDYVATGHYARNEVGQDRLRELQVSKDADKDQTYFLWTLTQQQLANVLFPVGGMKKSAVRALARTARLPVFDKKDSQGLCFLGPVDMKEFLGRFIPPVQGAVLNREGRIIGEHDGAHLYTLGERHGFTIKAQGQEQAPLYIVTKDIVRNTLTVAPQAESASGHSGVLLQDINWISGSPPVGGNIKGRIRYRGELHSVCLVRQGKYFQAVFETPLLVSPGQSLVFYQGVVCLGGAAIKSTQPAISPSRLSAILAS